MIASRDDVLDALDKLERATRSIPPDKKALFADAIESEKLTRAQLGDAVMTCVKRSKNTFFPAVGAILEAARPPGVNAPPSEGHKSADPIVALEREIEVQTAWMRKHEDRLNDFGVRMARKAIERAQDHINRRLQERGISKRYVGVGVEDFGASDLVGAPARTTQGDIDDWLHNSEDA